MNRSRTSRTIALIVGLAGTAIPVSAQNDPSSQPGRDPVRGDRLSQLDTPRDWQPGDDRDVAHANGAAPEFRSARWMDDRGVLNPAGEHIATMTDFIVDRGSGRIEYGIVKSGAVLGLGGKEIAIPYGNFEWNTRQEKLVLNLEKDQLLAQPEFSAKEWDRAMARSGGEGESALRDSLHKSSSGMRDPYDGKLAGAKATKIEGEIISVNRDRTAGEFRGADKPLGQDRRDQDIKDHDLKDKDLTDKDPKDRSDTDLKTDRDHKDRADKPHMTRSSGENVWLTVRTDDGAMRRVVLGPSWYVSSGKVTPMRGQRVVIDGVAPADDADKAIVARTITIDGQQIVLRTEDHAPLWMSPPATDQSGPSGAARRYVLLSTLTGASVDCRGVKCGNVHDVIIERESGEIAFLSIDPDKNFLGIGDARRLVPWQVATVFVDGDVHLDANREMVLASPETPGDLTTLNRAESVYRAYGIDAPDYRVTGRADAGRGRWGPVYAAMDRDSRATLTGTVIEVSDQRISDDLPSARVMKLRTSDGEKLVLLGPADAVQAGVPDHDGDAIVVETYRTTIDGKPYLVARTINVDGRQITLLENTGNVWGDGR